MLGRYRGRTLCRRCYYYERNDIIWRWVGIGLWLAFVLFIVALVAAKYFF